MTICLNRIIKFNPSAIYLQGVSTDNEAAIQSSPRGLFAALNVLRMSNGLHSVIFIYLFCTTSSNLFASKLLSYLGDSPAQHYNELILDVTEAAPTPLIVPVKVIGVEEISDCTRGFY